jgi:hypothetical protein
MSIEPTAVCESGSAGHLFWRAQTFFRGIGRRLASLSANEAHRAALGCRGLRAAWSGYECSSGLKRA